MMRRDDIILDVRGLWTLEPGWDFDFFDDLLLGYGSRRLDYFVTCRRLDYHTCNLKPKYDTNGVLRRTPRSYPPSTSL